jgi:hypothetical protein
MTLHLTEEQRRALQAAGEAPIRLRDPVTNQEYVVLRADLYTRQRGAADEGDFDPREAYPFVDRVMAEDDAADPALESYQQYRSEGPS